MLDKAEQRIRERGWTNVRLMDVEYGLEPIAGGYADVVLFSYSLSMFVDWKLALSCARAELRPGGRIGVVDFCSTDSNSQWFADWLAINHVQVDRPYENELRRLFCERAHEQHNVWAGLWSFFVFVGVHCPSSTIPQEAA
jgi:S-adenosylmethionine-diacylgycerolhomoserine-N-methlytransferase